MFFALRFVKWWKHAVMFISVCVSLFWYEDRRTHVYTLGNYYICASRYPYMEIFGKVLLLNTQGFKTKWQTVCNRLHGCLCGISWAIPERPEDPIQTDARIQARQALTMPIASVPPERWFTEDSIELRQFISMFTFVFGSRRYTVSAVAC